MGWIFTVDPITSIILWDLLVLYIQYLFMALAFALGIALLFPFEYELQEISLSKFFVCVVFLENCLMKIVPMRMFGVWGLYVGHILWAMLHIKIPIILAALILGILELRLISGGLYGHAIAMHLFHDLWLFSLGAVAGKLKVRL